MNKRDYYSLSLNVKKKKKKKKKKNNYITPITTNEKQQNPPNINQPTGHIFLKVMNLKRNKMNGYMASDIELRTSQILRENPTADTPSTKINWLLGVKTNGIKNKFNKSHTGTD